MPHSRTLRRINRARTPVVTLSPDQEPSPEQIVQSANGQLRIFQEGQKIGITLSPKDRPLFLAAIKQEYLRHSMADTRVVEVFSAWCDAKDIACVRFQIERDCLDIMSTNGQISEDPYVTMHFSVATTGRVFTKAGLVAVVKFLLDHVWDVTLSPWEVSAGVLPFSFAHQLMKGVFEIYKASEMTTTETEDLESLGRKTIH